jgi:hypothetical protein
MARVDPTTPLSAAPTREQPPAPAAPKPSLGKDRLGWAWNKFLGPPQGPHPVRNALEAFVAGSPLLDQARQALGLGAGAVNAGRTVAGVPAIPETLQAGKGAAGILTTLPKIGGFFTNLFSKISNSGIFQGIVRILSKGPVQMAGRFLGRIAPFLGVGLAAFDIRDAYRAAVNPNVSGTRKWLLGAKAAASSIAAGAGVATLVLAPTGVGALVAGAVALVAGLAAIGLDFAASRFAKE